MEAFVAGGFVASGFWVLGIVGFLILRRSGKLTSLGIKPPGQ
jgi:acyl dehydratase